MPATVATLLVKSSTTDPPVPNLLQNVAIIQAADAEHLERLLTAGLDRFAVERLGEYAVVVDHQRIPALKKLLERLGETPRLVTG